MDIDPEPPRCNRKRAAEDISRTTSAPTSTFMSPHILHRQHHRRRNIAASVWGPDIPVTPYASTPAPTAPFNIYKCLLRHPNLFFQFCIRLPLPTIIALYAIDKEFHYRLNKYSVSLIHDYARYHAPLASYVFSWVLYPELCISDPMLRPMDGRTWLARDVPGFRWVGMVMWRQWIVRGILSCLALAGHRVPRSMEGAVYKFWVLVEMNTTRMRTAFLHDKGIWSDEDILLVQLLLVKLDMRFADPTLGNGACSLAHMLLTQKSLSTLYYILTRTIKLDYDNTTDLVVRTYPTEDFDLEAHPWLDNEVENGVPEEWWGIIMREGWHPDGGRMESAVNMVIAEGVRRDLHVQQHLLDFVICGHVDGTRKNKMVRKWRRNKQIVESEGWPGKKGREKLIKTLDQRFGVGAGAKSDAMDTSAS